MRLHLLDDDAPSSSSPEMIDNDVRVSFLNPCNEKRRAMQETEQLNLVKRHAWNLLLFESAN